MTLKRGRLLHGWRPHFHRFTMEGAFPMDNHIWQLIEAVDDGWNIICLYRNEVGEEHVHTVSDVVSFEDSSYGNLRSCCWSGCSGDWPGCKMTCLLFGDVADKRMQERKEQEEIEPLDPFSFMLNHTCNIDNANCYVEEFDTLDGVHWSIAVDIEKQILDFLDQETETEAYQ